MRNVSLASNGVLFTVGSRVTLVLDSNVTLVGRMPGGFGNASNNNHLVRVSDGGTLIMNAGARITGNANNSNVPAIGGINTLGGGVFVSSGGTFVMHGGGISGNSSRSGGGVIVAGGTFTMHDGEIFGNTATTDNGGGVNVGFNGSGGSFTMHGGRIFDNTATVNNGGGVFVDWGGASFNMRGGEIFANTARMGGGVRNDSGGVFRMSDGVIYGSDAVPARRNMARDGGAALSGAAQHGVFNNGTFLSFGGLGTTNNTIRVVEGVQP